MAASSRRTSGSIHKIREFEMEKVSLSDDFDILQIVGEGWFGKILLVEHRATDTEMVLKALPKPYVSLRDFYREFHYNLHLGQHKNIITTYDVAFETAGFYVFTQEYAPLGDLTSNISETGIGELYTKRVARQISSALEYMHARELVHRDVKLDNVLVFRTDFSRVKLCDFGESRRAGAFVQRRNEWLPYSPPEVLETKTEDSYKTETSHDVWQFGIVIFVCLTGCLPWQKAASDDPRYNRYVQWHGSTSLTFPMKKQPKLFKLISNRASRMFRKFLEPRSERRVQSLSDLYKYLDDKWLAKRAEKDLVASEPDELCPSMYSFHSSAEEKNKLLYNLAQYGIETTVDRAAKKNRIRDWIQSSVIMEEEEEDDSGTATPSSTVSQSRTPMAGHVSSLRVLENTQDKIVSTVKDASNKHIDPRTGQIQEGPSEMGDAFGRQQNGNYSPPSQSSFDEMEEDMVSARLNIPVKTNDHNSHSNNHNNQNSLNNNNNSNNSTGSGNNQYSNNYPMNKSQSASAIKSNGNGMSATAGVLSAFNSLAVISVPEINHNNSWSSNNNRPIKDSGYGSIDSNNKPQTHSSPVLSKRPVQTTNSPINSSNNNNNNTQTFSNGFKNFFGRGSFKDSPYDRFKMNGK